MRSGHLAMRAFTAAGLAVDAYVHADLAGGAPVSGRAISEGSLFLVEAAFASAAASVVLVVPKWWTAAFALIVAASALGAVLLYRYVDVGTLGPLPNMYEPLWFAEKSVSAVAEAVATVTAAAALALNVRFSHGRTVSLRGGVGDGSTRHRMSV